MSPRKRTPSDPRNRGQALDAAGRLQRRRRTVSVRLTDAELVAWQARQQASGRKELGAWARAVIADAEHLHPADQPAPGDVPIINVPPINAEAYHQFAQVANNLNQLARRLNTTGEPIDAELRSRIGQLVDELADLGRQLRGR